MFRLMPFSRGLVEREQVLAATDEEGVRETAKTQRDADKATAKELGETERELLALGVDVERAREQRLSQSLL